MDKTPNEKKFYISRAHTFRAFKKYDQFCDPPHPSPIHSINKNKQQIYCLKTMGSSDT